jgi:hypothetical protein
MGYLGGDGGDAFDHPGAGGSMAAFEAVRDGEAY